MKERAMENRFDELAKALAGGMTRRDALRRLAGGLVAAMLTPLGARKAWGVPGTGRGEGCGNQCNRFFDPRDKSVREQRLSCVNTCELCKEEGGNPCVGSQGADCCSGAETCEDGVCVSSTTTCFGDAGDCCSGETCIAPGVCQSSAGDCFNCPCGQGCIVTCPV